MDSMDNQKEEREWMKACLCTPCLGLPQIQDCSEAQQDLLCYLLFISMCALNGITWRGWIVPSFLAVLHGTE